MENKEFKRSVSSPSTENNNSNNSDNNNSDDDDNNNIMLTGERRRLLAELSAPIIYPSHITMQHNHLSILKQNTHLPHHHNLQPPKRSNVNNADNHNNGGGNIVLPLPYVMFQGEHLNYSRLYPSSPSSSPQSLLNNNDNGSNDDGGNTEGYGDEDNHIPQAPIFAVSSMSLLLPRILFQYLGGTFYSPFPSS